MKTEFNFHHHDCTSSLFRMLLNGKYYCHLSISMTHNMSKKKPVLVNSDGTEFSVSNHNWITQDQYNKFVDYLVNEKQFSRI